MTSFTTAMLTRTTEDPCIGTSAPYISQNGNTITLTPQNCEHSVVLVRATPASTMIPREFIYTAPFDITEDTYISAYNLRAGYKLGDDASGKMFEFDETIPDLTIPFYVEKNNSDASTVVSFVENGSGLTLPDIEYSENRNTWTQMTWSGTTGSRTASVTFTGSRVYLRANATNYYTVISNTSRYIGMNFSGNCNVVGNMMSLLYGSSFTNQSEMKPISTQVDATFARFFEGNTRLIDASSLFLAPETTYRSCYSAMFKACSNLVNPPVIMAKTMTTSCFGGMFGNCTSLRKTPNLSGITTMADNCFDSMFSGCSSLTTLTSLPSTSMAEKCYEYMFSGCTSLTTAPALPATTLSPYCYRGMFSGCTSLVTAPSLPATTLDTGCYENMFYNCSALVTPPASLTATTMPSSGCNCMFYGCSSLTTAPVLPATTLGSSCYRFMFYGCSSLATAPELPATTLATGCYQYMFQNCTSLTRAPELPATKLVDHCYFVMFSGCSRLNYIKAMFTTTPANTYTQNWVSGVASNGTFVRDVDITWNVTGTNGVPSSWTIIHSLPEATSTPFYIQNETSSNGSIGILKNGSSAPVFNVYISTDNYDWVKQGSTDSTVTITLPANSRVYVRSQTSTWALSGQYNYVRFNTNSTDYSVGGNIMSLLYGHENYDNYTTFSGTNTFRYLLAYNSHIISAANLQLPDTVTDSCYKYMFYASPNLRNAPELPATTLVSSCYEGMFYHCTNLNNIKAMFTTTPGSDYTLDWVDGVAATGTFTKNASATWNVTGTSGVPSGWTVQTASA